MKMTLTILTALITASLFTGCMTIDPLTGEEKLAGTSKTAMTGAAIGGILGMALSKNDRKKGAILGAGIGALSGAAVGSYMDKQEAVLRDRLAGTGVSVTRVGDNLILNLPSNITFASGQADLTADFTKTLDGVLVVLEEYESTLITIDGHTDSVGSMEYNQGLSERRAMSVARYLSNKGIQIARFAAYGHGEEQPIASNDTAEGRAANRRVMLTLEPIT